jgi:uridine phosphorylase
MAILNKAEVTLGKRQNGTRLAPGDVGQYVLLPGDPDRVLRVAKYVSDAHEVANHREFRTWTGTFEGITVSAISTGIGCPSASMAVEELANIGVTHVIRIGSTAALQPGMKMGDLVISTGTMRNEGTTRFYVRDGFPAVPDHFLTHALIETAVDFRARNGKDFGIFVGAGACDDAFYGETPEWIEMLSKYKLLNIEMEGSAIFTVAHLRGLKAAMIAGVSANLATSDYIYGASNDKLADAWEIEIQVALETIARYHRHDSLAFKL